MIEVNPRSSRTVPFLSKVTGVAMIEIATRVMLGENLSEMNLGLGLLEEKDFYALKFPVFSMEKIDNVDVALGPEMKSTGEVMSIDQNFQKALLKGMIASTSKMPLVGQAIVSVSDEFKSECVPYIEALIDLGYKILMTPGTYKYMSNAIELMTDCEEILHSEVNTFINSEAIELLVNTPNVGKNSASVGFNLRRSAINKKIVCLTSIDTFRVFVDMMTHKIQIKDMGIKNLCDL